MGPEGELDKDEQGGAGGVVTEPHVGGRVRRQVIDKADRSRLGRLATHGEPVARR